MEYFLTGKHLVILLSFCETSKEYKPRSDFYGPFPVHKSRRSKLGRRFEVGLNVVSKHATSHNIPSALHSSSPEPWWRHFPPTIPEHMVGSSPAPLIFSLKSLGTSVIHMSLSWSLWQFFQQIYLSDVADCYRFFVDSYTSRCTQIYREHPKNWRWLIYGSPYLPQVP